MLADDLIDETKIPPHFISSFTRQPSHFENAAILFIYVWASLSFMHVCVSDILLSP